MRWLAALTGLAVLAVGVTPGAITEATAEAPEDRLWDARVKRARVAFAEVPDFDAGGVRGNAAFRLRVDRDQLAPAVGRAGQPIRVMLSDAVLFEGVTTDDLTIESRDVLTATRTRPDGEDEIRIDVRRGRIRLKLANASLDGMLDRFTRDLPFDVHVGDCVWTDYVEFDHRRPRLWSIRRVRLQAVPIYGAGSRAVGWGYVVRSRNQLVELARREDVYVPAAARERRPGLLLREWIDRVDFRENMVVAVVPSDAYAGISIDAAGPAPGGYVVQYTESKLPCGTYIAFFQQFPSATTRVVPRAPGPCAFLRRLVPPGCR